MLLLVLFAALPDDPGRALVAVDESARALESIRYGAVRKTTQKGAVVTEHWRYAAEPGGHFRIDYVGDTQRQITCDGSTLVDYVPARRAAQRFDLDRMEPAARAELLTNVVGKVSIPGLRTGIAASGLSDVQWGESGVVDGRATRTVVARGEGGAVLSWELDVEEGYVHASQIEDAGVFVFSSQSTGHRQVAPGTWVPSQVVSTAPAPGGRVRVEISLNQVFVGEDLPDSLFHADLDSSIRITELP